MPAPGYAFVEWGGDVNGNNESTTLVISCDTTVTAIFYRVQQTIAWWWPFVGIGAIGVMLLSYLLFIRKDSTPGNLPI